MKKILSILLSVLLLLSTMTVLTILPAVATTPESEPVNLIVNGDGSMGNWTADTFANSQLAQAGLVREENKFDAYGWYTYWVGSYIRDLSSASNSYGAAYSNYSPNNIINLNGWQTAFQDIEIEADKTYTLTASYTSAPLTAELTGAHLEMRVEPVHFGDSSLKNTYDYSNTISGKDWNLYTGHADEITANEAYFAQNKTYTYNNTTYYWSGDFRTSSITFDSNDFISEYSLTKNANGKYNCRVMLNNYSGKIFYFDDVSMHETVAIIAENGGYVEKAHAVVGERTTLVAKPYYGNSFKGWFNDSGELVSLDASLETVATENLTAKFNVYNQVVDGGFESPDGAGQTFFNQISGSGEGKNNKVMTTPESTSTIHGNNALYCVPTKATNTTRGLIMFPATVKKNTTYAIHFSYYMIDTADVARNVMLSVADFTDGWTFTDDDVYDAYTITWGLEGFTTPGAWNWKGTQTDSTIYFISTHNTSGVAVGKWVDMYLLVDTGANEALFPNGATEADIYYQFGIGNGSLQAYYLDNVSFTEVTSSQFKPNVTAETGGTITTKNNATPSRDLVHYQSTNTAGAVGTKPTDTHIVANTQCYTKVFTHATYTAIPKAGYKFIGWYTDDNKLFSTNATETIYAEGNFTAKFEPVPTYTITATAEKNADGIYGGYVINKSQVINEAENVTVNAVTYAGNTFEGWYNGETKVSSNESYTFTVASDVDLVAKWNVENLWPDSGYENTEVGVQQISHRNPEGMWHSAGNPWNWGYASVTTDYKYTGNASMAVTHRHNEVSAKLSVEPNTDYELSFNWLLGNSLQQGNVNPSFLKDVIIRGWDSSQIGYTDVTTYYSAEFQNTKVIFNSGDNSEVFIGFNYFAGSKPIYFDDVCLVPYDKETGTTDYFRVTYDFGVEEMENATEYVKAGEYTLRAGNFFFREPISVDFVNYTVNGETKAKGDVITVDGDVTVYMNYKAHDYGDMLTDTTSFGNDYELVLAALPDPQKLLVHHTDYYGMIGDWLLSKKNDISGIIALGDLTEYGGWPQYEAVYDTFKDVVAEIPFGVSLGNHDYPGGNGKGDWADNYEKEYNTIIYDHFFKDIIVDSLLANNGGAYPYTNVATDKYEAMSKDAKVESVEHTYYIYNDEYLVISLGIFPRDEVLDWADALAKANADKKVIVTTHSHIGRDGQILDDDDYYAIAKNETTNGGTVVRETLLETNPNIIMMVCGHASSTDTIYNRNIRADGTTYYEVLIDNQDDDENWQGVGNVTLLGFKDDGTIDFTTYSTVQQAYFNSANNEFSIKLGDYSVSDSTEEVEENTVIDTSAIDTNDYFIPYGGVYYTDSETGETKFVDKDADGKFTAPVTGKFNIKAFLKPGAEGVATFAASAQIDTDFVGKGTLQFGSYIPEVAEGKTYGTMFVTGDWDKFVEYYKNKGWTLDELVAKVSSIYDAKIENYDNVAISYGEEVVYVYKLNQKNYMYKNNTILEYALRVRNLAVDRTCTAIGYTKDANGSYTYSKNIVSANYNALMDN